MGRLSNRLGRVIVVLLGMYLALYPGSLIVVALDQVPEWGTWFGGVLIVLQGLLCGLWLCANYQWRGLLSGFVIAVLSFAVEYLGVTTGFPFGAYFYSDLLAPKLFGTVPLAIPFAWLLIVPAALEAARYLQRLDHPDGLPQAGLWLALGGATMAMLLDIVLEPMVTLINGYWIWVEGSGYYGVPLANFAGWWGTALLLIGITLLLTRRRGAPTVLPQLPLWLYLLSLLMFTLVNLAHSHIAAAAIGGLILSYMLFCRLERRIVRWVLKGERIANLELRRFNWRSSGD